MVTYIMLHQHLYSLSFKTTTSEKKNKGAVLKTVYDFSPVFGDIFLYKHVKNLHFIVKFRSDLR